MDNKENEESIKNLVKRHAKTLKRLADYDSEETSKELMESIMKKYENSMKKLAE